MFIPVENELYIHIYKTHRAMVAKNKSVSALLQKKKTEFNRQAKVRRSVMINYEKSLVGKTGRLSKSAKNMLELFSQEQLAVDALNKIVAQIDTSGFSQVTRGHRRISSGQQQNQIKLERLEKLRDIMGTQNTVILDFLLGKSSASSLQSLSISDTDMKDIIEMKTQIDAEIGVLPKSWLSIFEEAGVPSVIEGAIAKVVDSGINSLPLINGMSMDLPNVTVSGIHTTQFGTQGAHKETKPDEIIEITIPVFDNAGKRTSISFKGGVSVKNRVAQMYYNFAKKTLMFSASHLLSYSYSNILGSFGLLNESGVNEIGLYNTEQLKNLLFYTRGYEAAQGNLKPLEQKGNNGWSTVHGLIDKADIIMVYGPTGIKFYSVAKLFATLDEAVVSNTYNLLASTEFQRGVENNNYYTISDVSVFESIHPGDYRGDRLKMIQDEYARTAVFLNTAHHVQFDHLIYDRIINETTNTILSNL